MKYLDINCNSIEQRFYRETFYKGNDEFRNRNIWITKLKGFKGLYTVADDSAPVKLNSNYSQWLKPLKKKELRKKLSSIIDNIDNLTPSLSMDNQEIREPPTLPPELRHLEGQL